MLTAARQFSCALPVGALRLFFESRHGLVLQPCHPEGPVCELWLLLGIVYCGIRHRCIPRKGECHSLCLAPQLNTVIPALTLAICPSIGRNEPTVHALAICPSIFDCRWVWLAQAEIVSCLAGSREVAEARAIAVLPVLWIFISLCATAVPGELGDVDVFLHLVCEVMTSCESDAWCVRHSSSPVAKRTCRT